MTFPNSDGTGIPSSFVFVDHTRLSTDRENIYVILHEIFHSLGRGHVLPSQFAETVMHPLVDDGAENLVLYTLDTDALFAVHGTLIAPGQALERRMT